MDQKRKLDINKYIQRLYNVNVDQLKLNIKEDITDTDIRHYLDDESDKDVIKYSEIGNYKTLRDILPSNNSYKIILVESSYNNGHWISLYRKNKTITIFNSYGGFPSSELNFVSNKNNKLLGQNIKHLNILLENGLKNGFKIVYNKRKLQELKNGVNTCGKWVLLFIMLMENYDIDLKGFLQMIDKLVYKFKLTPDELVSLIIVKN